MINKILIANRGEIAVRIIRACRDMGIISIAVYSEADKDALHTQIADEAVCIGPASIKDSYLNMQAILSAATALKADAIHPGFGFLSESARFALLCEKMGIQFIGPSHETISMLGNKAKARETMERSEVPVIPGSDGVISSYAKAKKVARDIGYPIMVKASAGGGGRGIRLVQCEAELENAFNTAKSEALSCFGDDGVYLEKFIENPHHIEIQILGDKLGNIVHLFERECSIQRRNQKLIEESPSPFITDKLRKKMGEAAIKAAKAAGYINAGTIEFLVDKNHNFYFMEMNTRIQVEHPVTEFITGVDLVKEQINIADGKKLSISQKDIEINGHAIEVRINAEDASKNFTPCPGTIKGLHMPGGPGVRVDSAIYQGYSIPPFYDSMIAKLICHGNNRTEALARLKRALAEFLFDGITTNAEFQMEILKDKDFENGNYSVNFLQTHDIAERIGD